MSKLYVVGTPIGNLGDFSPRAIETLKEVSYIYAEDTRVSRGLLTHFGISTPMASYHEHNQKERNGEVLGRLFRNESCALITDAGMPAISDPGQELVRLCGLSQIEVVAVPGPTAAMTALAISGFPSRRFLFEGFLEGKESEKRTLLHSLKELPHTLIFYEAPHHLIDTLALLHEILGDRPIALCRELTKLHEEVQRTTLSQALLFYEENAPRGEFVLIIEGKKPDNVAELSLEEAVAMVKNRANQDISLSQAAKEVAEVTGYKKGSLYKLALEQE